MGNSNFNLAESVSNYIAQVNQQGSLTSSDQAELSAHLYDATDDLQRSGLTEEEAFTIACKRLGNQQLLTDEYCKVNPSIKTNKVWAYLLLGFNMFYTIPAIIHFMLATLYFYASRHLDHGGPSIIVLTGAHLFICISIIWLVMQKSSISRWVEKKVEQNAVLITSLSFLPLALAWFLSYFRILNMGNGAYLANEFNSKLIENSYYLIFVTLNIAGFALVFSIDKPGRISLKSFVEKPTTWLLLLAGVLVEMIAAFSRAFYFGNLVTTSVAFGLVYLLASYTITTYNKTKALNYLLKFCAFGFFGETVFGLLADTADRNGNIQHTVYFVSALLIGAFAGWVIGMKTGKKVEVAN